MSDVVSKTDDFFGLPVGSGVAKRSDRIGLLIGRYIRFKRDVERVHVSCFAQRGGDGVGIDLSRVIGHVDDLKGAAGIDVLDARKSGEDAPDLKYMVIPVHGRDRECKFVHGSLSFVSQCSVVMTDREDFA